MNRSGLVLGAPSFLLSWSTNVGLYSGFSCDFIDSALILILMGLSFWSNLVIRFFSCDTFQDCLMQRLDRSQEQVMNSDWGIYAELFE